MSDPIPAMWRAVKPLVPTQLYRFLAVPYRQYVRTLCWYHSRLRDPPAADGYPLPPAALRHRVIGLAAAAAFSRTIPRLRAEFADALARTGRSLDGVRSVLDFGAGCGRGLRGFAGLGMQLCGTDTDAEAIEWCRAHLPFARWEVNREFPPLAFDDEQFDLVYAISVFTHLDERHQFAWLEELRRVARPGALALLTVHGAATTRNVPGAIRTKLERDGFVYVPTFHDAGRFPDWYQSAYHTEAYARRAFGRYFRVLDYQPGAIGGQDLFILERTKSEYAHDPG